MQEAIESRKRVFRVKKILPLINLKDFNIIDSFVPYFMHNINLGVVKQFTNYCLNSFNKPYSFSNESVDDIAKQMKLLKYRTN